MKRCPNPKSPTGLLFLPAVSFILLGTLVACTPQSKTVPDAGQLHHFTPPSPSSSRVYLQGYRTPGDGGQGWFRWQADSMNEPDHGTIFGDQDKGRWIREESFDGSLNVLWYGACGNGKPENAPINTLAFNRAAQACQSRSIGIPAKESGSVVLLSGATLLIPSGHYHLDGPVTALPHILKGEGQPILHQISKESAIFQAGYFYSPQRIEGITFVGGSRQIDACNANLNITRLDIRDCDFVNAHDTAIHIHGNLIFSRPKFTLPLVSTPGADSRQVSLAQPPPPELLVRMPVGLKNKKGERLVTCIRLIEGNTLTLHHPVPPHWSGEAAMEPTLSFGDPHTSANVTITGGRILNPRQWVNACVDWITIRNVWFDAGSQDYTHTVAVAGVLWYHATLDGFFAECPASGRFTKPPPFPGARYWDILANLSASNLRMGTEGNQPIPFAYWGGPSTYHPYISHQILIQDSILFGPGNDPSRNTLLLLHGLPKIIHMERVQGASDLHYVMLDTSYEKELLDHDLRLLRKDNQARTDLSRFFRWEFEQMNTWGSTPTDHPLLKTFIAP